MTPAEKLLSIALESEQEARRIAHGVGIRVVLPGAPTDQEMRDEGQARLTRLVAHFEGRGRLYRRCARAAIAIDAQEAPELPSPPLP